MMIPCIMIVFMIVLSFSSKVYAGRRMNTCEDTLDSSSEFSCQDAELGILYGVISSCTEDLSTNSFVQQSAPGTTGTLCDVCCATCTNEFYASCETGGESQIDNSTIPTLNCTKDMIDLYDIHFTCEHAMEALNSGIIESCQEDLTQNEVIRSVYPEAVGTLCDHCCVSCQENQQVCINITDYTNSSDINTNTTNDEPTNSTEHDDTYQCIPRVPETLPDFCYACE